MKSSTPSPQLPPCSEWHVWVGPEIEGTQDVGVRTLFIRSLEDFPSLRPTDDLSVFRTNSKCPRVWFCKEFTDWPMLRSLARHFESVCIEVEPKAVLGIPADLRRTARIYYKVVLVEPPKDGDMVCIGLPFQDEAFEIGKGAKVKPEDYRRDTKVK